VSFNTAFHWLPHLLHVWEVQAVETWVPTSHSRECPE